MIVSDLLDHGASTAHDEYRSPLFVASRKSWLVVEQSSSVEKEDDDVSRMEVETQKKIPVATEPNFISSIDENEEGIQIEGGTNKVDNLATLSCVVAILLLAVAVMIMVWKRRQTQSRHQTTAFMMMLGKDHKKMNVYKQNEGNSMTVDQSECSYDRLNQAELHLLSDETIRLPGPLRNTVLHYARLLL